MNQSRPKQHVHNWKLGFTEFSSFTKTLPEVYKDYDSPGGFYLRRYYKCVRGGKIKHTIKAPNPLTYGRSFIMASGIPYHESERV